MDSDMEEAELDAALESEEELDTSFEEDEDTEEEEEESDDDPEPDPPLGFGLVALFVEREAGYVDNIVEQPNGGRHQLLECRHVESRLGRKGLPHQPR